MPRPSNERVGKRHAEPAQGGEQLRAPRGDRVRVRLPVSHHRGNVADAPTAPFRRICRRRAPQQVSEEFDPGRRLDHQCTQQEMLQQVVAPDIDDVGDLRADLRDIGEILVWADPDICSAGQIQLAQFAEDMQI